MNKFIECLFGFETGDDATIKALKVFAGVARTLFVIMFFAYCTFLVWVGWLNK